MVAPRVVALALAWVGVAAALAPSPTGVPFGTQLKFAQSLPAEFVKNLFAASAPELRDESLAALREASVDHVPGAMTARECEALRELIGRRDQLRLRDDVAETPSFARLVELPKRFAPDARLTAATLYRRAAPRHFARVDATVCVDVALSPPTGGLYYCLANGTCDAVPRELGDAMVTRGATVRGSSAHTQGDHYSLVLLFETEEDRNRRDLAELKTKSLKTPGSLYRKRKPQVPPAQWFSRERAKKALFDPVDDDAED